MKVGKLIIWVIATVIWTGAFYSETLSDEMSLGGPCSCEDKNDLECMLRVSNCYPDLYSKTPDAYPDLLEIAMNNKDDEIVSSGVMTLVAYGNGTKKEKEMFRDMILHNLSSEKTRLQLDAIAAMGAIGDERDCPVFIKTFHESRQRNSITQILLLQNIAMICDENGEKELIAIISEMRDKKVESKRKKDTVLEHAEIALRDLKRKLKKDDMRKEKDTIKKKEMIIEIKNLILSEIEKTPYIDRKGLLNEELDELIQYEANIDNKTE